MTDVEFRSLSKSELLAAAQEAQKSGQALFDMGQAGAGKANYGAGNSMLILSAEESIKSAILIAGYFGIILPFDVTPYFKDHKTKHRQAAEIQPVINFIWTVRDLYVQILRDRKSALTTVFNIAITYFSNSLGWAMQEKQRQAEDFTGWWSRANEQKNNGFYVGYFSGKWSFPSQITRETYNVTLSMTQPFIECLQVVHDFKIDDHLLFTKSNFEKSISAGLEKLSPSNSSETFPDFSEYKIRDDGGTPDAKQVS